MHSTNYFKVFNASAGTGKTFSLVKDYLILILESKNIELYKKILAITFTNKAVNEMKKRIIKYLINYSNSIDPDNIMIHEIKNETDLTDKEIFSKSSKILKNLLKNYSAFEISTIDKFTQKIVRNFTYELGIDSKYEIEMDHEEILNKAVDNLISKIKLNDKNSQNIINFSFEKTYDDKNWDVTYDLQNVAQLLFDESHNSEISSLKDFNSEDFENLINELKSKIKALNFKAKELGNKALLIIKEENINHESFIRQTIPKHFIKISTADFNNLYSNKIENNLIDGNLFSSKASEIDKLKIEEVRKELLNIYRNCRSVIYQEKLFKNILNNITPLSVLSQIKNELELLKKDENFILISEFNKIVNDEIKNQPAPFIYEKIGTKFNHYFIDEFQDTSKIQWENLKPLVENCLASENSSLTIAGDPKQSIYRWRGGDVEGFMNMVSSKSPFFCEKYNISLDKNYRSSKEIIDFNDNLFKHIVKIYSVNDKLSKILDFPKQQPFSDGGYINLAFCDNKLYEKEEFYNITTLKNIQDIISRGYSYRDICIIVRRKKEGIIIGDFLTENKIPIISSEVLNLSSSPEVNLILNLIEYSISESNSNKIKFCKSLHQLNFIDIPKEEFLMEVVDLNFNEIQKYISIKGFELNLNKLKGVSIYEALEYIIDEFEIMKTGNSYVQFFLDFAIDYTNKFQTSLSEFLDYYDEIKEKLNIISPQEINAVEIMTIHKSKGLEFPVVIYPYANINIHGDLNPKTWINLENYKEFNLKKSLININKDLEKIDLDLYNNYKWELEVDNINLLYVTLTRAEKELYIISEKNIDSKGNEKINFFSGIFINYLKETGDWDNNKFIYEIGEKAENKTKLQISKNIVQNEIVVNSRIKQNIIISSKNTSSWIYDYDTAKEEGNIFHNIMAEVYSAKDIKIVLNKFFELGNIDLNQKNKYENIITKITLDPRLIGYYDDNLISFNEREIISSKGKSLIPDRLIFLDKIRVVVIDYKTGVEEESHLTQLKKYEQILKEMGLKVVKKILVYIAEKIEIKIPK